MPHAIFVSKIRHYRNKFGGHKLQTVIGFMVAVYGALAIVFGLPLLLGSAGGSGEGAMAPSALPDRDQSGGCMSLVGGIFLFFTGLWFLTRGRVNWRGNIGFCVMLSAILGGTWGGRFIMARSHDGEEYATATIVFFCGLLLHLLGVLYVKNE